MGCSNACTASIVKPTRGPGCGLLHCVGATLHRTRDDLGSMGLRMAGPSHFASYDCRAFGEFGRLPGLQKLSSTPEGSGRRHFCDRSGCDCSRRRDLRAKLRLKLCSPQRGHGLVAVRSRTVDSWHCRGRKPRSRSEAQRLSSAIGLHPCSDEHTPVSSARPTLCGAEVFSENAKMRRQIHRDWRFHVTHRRRVISSVSFWQIVGFLP